MSLPARLLPAVFAVIFVALAASNISLSNQLTNERQEIEQLDAQLMPLKGARLVLDGYVPPSVALRFSPGGLERFGSKVHIEPGPDDPPYLMFYLEEGCSACSVSLPNWKTLATRSRGVNSGVRIVVMDQFASSRVNATDDIDFNIHPDFRLTPTAEAVARNHLYRTPITLLVRHGIVEEVASGAPSGSDQDRWVRGVQL